MDLIVDNIKYRWGYLPSMDEWVMVSGINGNFKYRRSGLLIVDATKPMKLLPGMAWRHRNCMAVIKVRPGGPQNSKFFNYYANDIVDTLSLSVISIIETCYNPIFNVKDFI